MGHSSFVRAEAAPRNEGTVGMLRSPSALSANAQTGGSTMDTVE